MLEQTPTRVIGVKIKVKTLIMDLDLRQPNADDLSHLSPRSGKEVVKENYVRFFVLPLVKDKKKARARTYEVVDLLTPAVGGRSLDKVLLRNM